MIRLHFLQLSVLFSLIFIIACTTKKKMTIEAYETSASGKKMEAVPAVNGGSGLIQIRLNPNQEFQTITGFGGSFTEASAYILNQLSSANRQDVLNAYFGEEGARYSLTRTHINSCDFSLSNYSYAPKEDDIELDSFSIQEDMDDIIPMIKDAMKLSQNGFKIISSPWTAPPWMKDNNDWRAGKLLPKYYNTWALFFSKYLKAYEQEGIKIWGITVENEPVGNDGNWESMHFTPGEMTDFVVNHLGPKLEENGHDVVLLGYDQNRGDELVHWATEMYRDSVSRKYFDGMAIHWYASTYDHFPESLQFTHEKAPNKHLIQTEACVDAEVPKWKDDQWYWSKEATDWGWDWAPEDQKYLHPKYVPVYRYARDIIGCLNNWVDGWVDWNMVLDRQGGPNWFKNWCVAPVIVDKDLDEVYYTPLYYTLSHFSRFIRPGAKRIGFEVNDEELLVTSVKNPDGSIVTVLFNPTGNKKEVAITFDGRSVALQIDSQAIQTIIIKE